jgi:hypothetical protein
MRAPFVCEWTKWMKESISGCSLNSFSSKYE